MPLSRASCSKSCCRNREQACFARGRNGKRSPSNSTHHPRRQPLGIVPRPNAPTAYGTLEQQHCDKRSEDFSPDNLGPRYPESCEPATQHPDGFLRREAYTSICPPARAEQILRDTSSVTL